MLKNWTLLHIIISEFDFFSVSWYLISKERKQGRNREKEGLFIAFRDRFQRSEKKER